MGGTKSPASTWCLLRSSQRLRAAILWKFEKLNMTWGRVAKETGIPPYCISMYVNDKKRKAMSQYQLITLCKFLGIDVSLELKFRDSDGMVSSLNPSA